MKLNHFLIERKLLIPLFMVFLSGSSFAQQSDCLSKLENWNRIGKNESKPVPPTDKMMEYVQCVGETEKSRESLLNEMTGNPEKRMKDIEKDVAVLKKDSAKAADNKPIAKQDSTDGAKYKTDLILLSKQLALKRDSLLKIKTGIQMLKLYNDVLRDSYKRLINQYDREDEDVKKAEFKSKLNKLDD